MQLKNLFVGEAERVARGRSRWRWWLEVLALLGCGAGIVCAQDLPGGARRSPCVISAGFRPGDDGRVVRLHFTLPPRFVLYAERLHFLGSSGAELAPLELPEPVWEWDESSHQRKQVYTNSFSASVKLPSADEARLLVRFQGCTNGACFFPEKRLFVTQAGGTFAEVAPGDELSASVAGAGGSNWLAEAHHFKLMGQQTGYLKASQFTAFLDRALTGGSASDEPLSRFQRLGLVMTLLLIVGGGFLLNFTPCVLPMIPINLAIIGAGARARNRAAGFRNGALYGAGMAITYGVLGLVVVLTGAKFGALNSSVAFNVAVALVFVVLALGMFDVLSIDLSRFGGAFRRGTGAGAGGSVLGHAVVVGMGALAALLAGACVAPVVISVILLATGFYAKGVWLGLALPFLLGLGMALPWPVAGAGLSLLPKPGKWMKWVKYSFGILILGFAGYYAHTAYGAFQAGAGERAARVVASRTGSNAPGPSAEAANHELLGALEQARAQGRAVFIDFHASWCKSCLAMEETVFNQPAVKKRLEDFIVVRYAAELPNEPPAREVLDHFGVIGLPAYVVVAPN